MIPRQHRTRTWRLGCGILLILAIALAWGMIANFVRTENHVSSAEANARMHHLFEIPSAATDVNYYSTPIMTIVDVAVDEPTFLAWCHSRQWTVKPIDSNEPSSHYTVGPGGKVSISQATAGYRFNEMEGDFGFCGGYDALAGRAWASFSTR